MKVEMGHWDKCDTCKYGIVHYSCSITRKKVATKIKCKFHNKEIQRKDYERLTNCLYWEEK